MESKWNTTFRRLRGRVCVKKGRGRGRGRENLGARTPAAQSRLFGEGKKRNEFALRNGMWYGLRNDIIMRNLIYADHVQRNKLN